MNKKITKSFLGVLALALSGASIVSCGDGNQGETSKSQESVATSNETSTPMSEQTSQGQESVATSSEQHTHAFDSAWSYDGKQHWHACSGENCSEKKDVADHSFEDIAGVEATCTEEGNVAYKHCTVCEKNFDADGKEITDTKIEAKGHSYGELVAKKDSDCSMSGMEAHYKCSDCGTYFDENKNPTTEEALTIAPKGHHYGEARIKYTWDYVAVRECTDCPGSYEGHLQYGRYESKEIVNTKGATCKEKGSRTVTLTFSDEEAAKIEIEGNTLTKTWEGLGDYGDHSCDEKGVCSVCGTNISKTITSNEDEKDVVFEDVANNKIYFNFEGACNNCIAVNTKTQQSGITSETEALVKSIDIYDKDLNKVCTMTKLFSEDSGFWHWYWAYESGYFDGQYYGVVTLDKDYDEFTLKIDIPTHCFHNESGSARFLICADCGEQIDMSSSLVKNAEKMSYDEAKGTFTYTGTFVGDWNVLKVNNVSNAALNNLVSNASEFYICDENGSIGSGSIAAGKTGYIALYYESAGSDTITLSHGN